MWIDVDRFRYPSLCFRVVLESISCLTQYRIMVMIMHSNGDTCHFDRDGMILWGEFLIILLAAPESCTYCTYAIAVRWRTGQGQKSGE